MMVFGYTEQENFCCEQKFQTGNSMRITPKIIR